MLQILWSPEMSTGIAAMDALHHDLFESLVRLSSVANKKFGACYEALVTKVERAFALEEKWMEEIDFPALKSHREQHARVLGALHNVHSKVMNGNLVLGRDVIDRLLPQWLILHIETMDMPLAISLQIAGEQATPSISAPSEAYAE